MYIVKLGGSVITDKSKKYSFNKGVTSRLAKEIHQAKKDIILVHGAGSFGHILAKEYQLNEGHVDDHQLQGFSLTHAKVQELNSFVLNALHDNDIAAVSIAPHSILSLDDHKPKTMNYQIFKDFLDSGFTPVTFGDVVLDETLRFSIISGDLLVQMLASYFRPEKVIFVIDEDGIYSSNPKTDKNAEFIESATIEELQNFATTANAHADVTKGMEGKIDTIKHIAQLGIDTVLLNGNKHNRLYDILNEKDTKCTIVAGGKV